MSRKINPKVSVTMSEEEISWRRTDIKKLLFTSYRGRNCALLLQDNRLLAASFFSKESSKVGAVYVAKVKNMMKNIEACFVEIAEGELCFLPLKNAVTPYLLNRTYDGRILEGDELLVQVVRDAQKSKRASATAHVSLSNEYFAISIGSPRVGYSTKLSKEKKKVLRRMVAENLPVNPENGGCLIQDYKSLLWAGKEEEILKEGLVPENLRLPSIGFVVRTKAGEVEDGRELSGYFSEISVEFFRLLYNAMYRNCFSCLKESAAWLENIMNQYMEDYPDGEFSETELSKAELSKTELSKTDVLGIDEAAACRLQSLPEIITDQEALYLQLKDYCEGCQMQANVRMYTDSMITLSSLYSIHTKMDAALGSRVWLKSGGYLVIEPTEALTVIDVNSGKCDLGGASRDTYLKINMEAAQEVAIQLRLRNLSGIILVDFINMQFGGDDAQLLAYLRALVKQDKVKTTVVDMTPLGLVEITRKKINKPLKEQYNELCL